MIFGLYHSAAGMLTNEYRQAVIANNLANAETAGFKRDLPTFAERLNAVEAGFREGASDPNLAGMSGGLWLGGTHTDYSPGPWVATENPTDVALDGDGFFTVQSGGQTLYTRDGRFMMAPDGRLVSVTDGAPVLGVGGAPLVLNPAGGPLAIASDGRVQQDGGVRGQLGLANFRDYDALRKAGAARFAADANAEPAAPTARIQQGYVENSTVQPLIELVGMLEAANAYQLNARMITMQDESVGRLLSATLRA